MEIRSDEPKTKIGTGAAIRILMPIALVIAVIIVLAYLGTS
jgi:hypothetical protein